MVIETVNTMNGVRALQPAWKSVFARSSSPDIFLSFEWITNWLDHFAGSAQPHFLYVHDRGEPVAIVPWIQERGTWCRLPARLLRFCTNNHSLRSGIIIGHRPMRDVSAAVFDHLNQLGGWDIVVMDGVLADESGFANELNRRAMEANIPALVRGTWPQSYLRMCESWDSYFKEGLTRHFRKRYKAARSKLDKLGSVEFDFIARPEQIQDGMRQFMEIDQASWKGDDGETVTSTPLVQSFYETLVKRLAASGNILVVVLRVNGEPAGGVLCLTHGGTVYTLKTSYKERLASGEALHPYSPGMLSFVELIRHAHDAGFKALDFVGRCAWTDRLTTSTREYEYAVQFRSAAYPRLLYGLDRGIRRLDLDGKLRRMRLLRAAS